MLLCFVVTGHVKKMVLFSFLSFLAAAAGASTLEVLLMMSALSILIKISSTAKM